MRTKSSKQTNPSSREVTPPIIRRQSSRVQPSSPRVRKTPSSSSADILPSPSESKTLKAPFSSSSTEPSPPVEDPSAPKLLGLCYSRHRRWPRAISQLPPLRPACFLLLKICVSHKNFNCTN
ncbi:unnamed protein product [Spirodela intermedia]|uniref:Uncharacterized protein n=1 Tax=Spirodela intermedia TaxID=51605 RepID=A0A7I8IWB3_SPIIN|nr:unnamed protein product [Spirodela intermedia]CAA6662100.1 unnamed protein product [Spirodela intermedia]